MNNIIVHYLGPLKVEILLDYILYTYIRLLVENKLGVTKPAENACMLISPNLCIWWCHWESDQGKVWWERNFDCWIWHSHINCGNNYQIWCSDWTNFRKTFRRRKTLDSWTVEWFRCSEMNFYFIIKVLYKGVDACTQK